MTLLQILLKEAVHLEDEAFHLEDEAFHLEDEGVYLEDEEAGVAVDCVNSHFASQ